MRVAPLSCALLFVGSLVPALALADFGTDDRIAVSGNGSSLTGTSGGGGGSAAWLHNFNPDALAALAVEHQVLSVSNWTFGSLTGSVSGNSGDARYGLTGEVHEGHGDDGGHGFRYAIEAIGVSGTWFHQLTAQVEDRQVNVEATHGNLPKVGVSYLWNPHFQTGVSYQYSFGGNLGTRLTSARIDIFGSKVNFLVGGATGQSSPTILGLFLAKPATHLEEGYVGLTKPFPSLRSELTLIVDYLHLSGGTGQIALCPVCQGTPGQLNQTFFVPASERWTGTLNYVFHIGHQKH